MVERSLCMRECVLSSSSLYSQRRAETYTITSPPPPPSSSLKVKATLSAPTFYSSKWLTRKGLVLGFARFNFGKEQPPQ
ncbi:hypothetical protein MKW98_029229 [Papaver atlanticum]|uniref:Uncharacterized protein n=1 Tax=Papaver atlanticum TaxID=357466 RepID=A0AAD4XQL5_9MAGN|nr:hypothetical protein MKW98_029229 [Papaver atlanticum]